MLRSYATILFVLLSFCHVVCCAQHDVIRKKIVQTALQYEGLIERNNQNDGAIFDYMRAIVDPRLNAYKGQKPATCAFFVNLAFRESGYIIKCVQDKGRAFAYLNCPDPVKLGKSTTAAKVKSLKVGMIVIYDFSHVGIITGVYPTYVTTIESNTSTIGTVRNYQFRRGGIYEKIRKYSFISTVTDCAKCAESSDNTKILQLKKVYAPFNNN